jgi:hydrogenase small subunit
MAYNDCYFIHSNAAMNSRSNCLGCTEKDFPDCATPFYERMPGVNLPGITASADAVGGVLGVAVAAGIGAHLVGSIAKGRTGKKEEGGEE